MTTKTHDMQPGDMQPVLNMIINETMEIDVEAMVEHVRKTTTYVELPSVAGLPSSPEDLKRVEEALTDLGLKNYTPQDAGVRLQARYVVVNYEKGVFVSSYEDHGNLTVPMEDFLNGIRGRLTAKKFNF